MAILNNDYPSIYIPELPAMHVFNCYVTGIPCERTPLSEICILLRQGIIKDRDKRLWNENNALYLNFTIPVEASFRFFFLNYKVFEFAWPIFLKKPPLLMGHLKVVYLLFMDPVCMV